MTDTPDGPVVRINGMEFGPGTGRKLKTYEDPSHLRVPGTGVYSPISVKGTKPPQDGLLRVNTRFSEEILNPPEANIMAGVLYRVTGVALEVVESHDGHSTLEAGVEYILSPPGLANKAFESLPSQFLRSVPEP